MNSELDRKTDGSKATVFSSMIVIVGWIIMTSIALFLQDKNRSILASQETCRCYVKYENWKKTESGNYTVAALPSDDGRILN